LVVDDDVRLGKECHEAVFDPKVFRRVVGIVPAAAAPRKENDPVAVQFANVFDSPSAKSIRFVGASGVKFTEHSTPDPRPSTNTALRRTPSVSARALEAPSETARAASRVR
jgi:hypothetical protein